LESEKPVFSLSLIPVNAPSNQTKSRQNGKHPAQNPRRDEGGRRRSTVTSLNQRMDELDFLLALPNREKFKGHSPKSVTIKARRK
jgi:hypothetical protein